MTQSDQITEKAAREGSPPADAGPEINAQARARARATVTRPAPVALDAVTAGARAVRRHGRSVTALLDRPESLFDTRPPSFREVRAWHRQCAVHYSAGLIRWPRQLWAFIHLFVIMPALRAAEWVTASPARFAVALAVALVVWYWS